MAAVFEPGAAGSCFGRSGRFDDVGRAGLPLALTLLVHLLLVLAWCFSRGSRPVEHAQREELVYLQVSASRAPVDVPKPRPLRAVAAPISAPSQAKPSIKDATIRTEPLLAAPLTAAPARPAPSISAAPLDPLAAPAQSSLSARESALRDAGNIDRDLRGKIAPAARQGTPFSNFQSALAGAHIEKSPVQMARYTSPDGVVITRVTQGSKVRCYMSGTVNFAPGVLKDGARPQPVNCPTSGWTPY
ncbi:MAG: hypothetical protein V4582_01780 [Pseudomonadota bacterium]